MLQYFRTGETNHSPDILFQNPGTLESHSRTSFPFTADTQWALGSQLGLPGTACLSSHGVCHHGGQAYLHLSSLPTRCVWASLCPPGIVSEDKRGQGWGRHVLFLSFTPPLLGLCVCFGVSLMYSVWLVIPSPVR